jgi:hypothetical protein
VTDPNIGFIMVTCRDRVDAGFDEHRMDGLIPGLLVCHDAEMQGPFLAHYRALKMGFECGFEWVVVLEDDAVLCDDFVRKVGVRLVEARQMGGDLVLFHKSCASKQYEGRWLVQKWEVFWSAVCIAYHFEFLRSFLAQLDDEVKASGGTYRESGIEPEIRWFLSSTKKTFLEVNPHLVQHGACGESTGHAGSQHRCWPSCRFRRDGD